MIFFPFLKGNYLLSASLVPPRTLDLPFFQTPKFGWQNLSFQIRTQTQVSVNGERRISGELIVESG
jgi:hypothetical protein